MECQFVVVEDAIHGLPDGDVALERKNFLFAGLHETARWPAVIYSHAAITRNDGVAPFDAFKEPLIELPKLKSSRDINRLLLPQ